MLIKIKNWIKDKWIKFKKIILSILIIPTAIAAPIAVDDITHPVGLVDAVENHNYKMGILNYDFELKKNITDENPLIYKLEDKYIAFKSESIKWSSQSKNLKNLSSSLKNNNKYDGIFGQGIDLLMQVSDRTWNKTIKIDNLEVLGEIPNEAEYLEIYFKIDTNFVIDGWDRKSNFEILDKVRLGDYSYIEQANAWDSTQEEICEIIEGSNNPDKHCELITNRIIIPTILQRIDLTNLYFVKKIPVDWLKAAKFPIYTDTDITYGSSSQFESGGTDMIDVCEIGTNKFVVVYQDSGDGDNGKAIVGSVSGTTITWGSISTFNAAATGGGSGGVYCAKLDTDKFVVCYQDDGDVDNDGKCRAVTVSGTTIGTWGTEAEFESGYINYLSACSLGTNKFVITYRDDDEAGDDGKAVVSTVSGTTITHGTPSIFTDGAGHNSAGTDCVMLDTDKFVVLNADYNDGGDGDVKVATVSGTVPTWGTAVEIEDSISIYSWNINIASPDTDSFVAFYNDGVLYSGVGVAIAGTAIATRTITLGSKTNMEAGAVKFVDLVDIDTTHFVATYEDSSNSGYGTSSYSSVDFSDRTIASGTAEVWDAGEVEWTGTDEISSNKIVVCFADDDGGDDGECIIGDLPSETAQRLMIIQSN